MISESETPLSNFPASKLDSLLTPAPSSNWLSNHGSGSGGFAENVFVAAAKEIYDQTASSPLEFRVVKNSDFQVINQYKKLSFLCWSKGTLCLKLSLLSLTHFSLSLCGHYCWFLDPTAHLCVIFDLGDQSWTRRWSQASFLYRQRLSKYPKHCPETKAEKMWIRFCGNYGVSQWLS